jgi:hypothetical protein
MDTKLKRSKTFHPHTYGKTEVVNRTLVQLLRGYNHKNPKAWDEILIYIQHSYNREVHNSTGKSPLGPTYHRGLSDRNSCKAGKRYIFAKGVQNY